MHTPIHSAIKRLHRSATATAFLVLILFSYGCSDDDDTVTPPPPEDPRKTIAGTLQELIDAYEARDVDRYAALFDQDSFLFVFDPIEVNDPDTDLPPSWGWEDEESANRNLFQAQLVERIQVYFVVGSPEPATKQDVEERAFPEGTMKVIATNVSLIVDTRDPAGSENIRYHVDGDNAIFFLYPDQNEVVDGVPVWKIVEWRDKTIGAPFVELKSWGGVKSLYR
jgi:hypothetical protein